MKTPEEIKGGLKCCHINDEDLCECEYCPYAHKGWQTARCDIELAEDALDLIQQLEAENNSLKFTKATDADVHRYQKKEMRGIIQQFESKLNRAVEDFHLLGRTGEFICPVCAYYNNGEGTKGECVKCLTGDGFRWRGEDMNGGAEG